MITQKVRQSDKKLIFKRSKEAALACKKAFPMAQVMYRGTSKASKKKWKPLTLQQILDSPSGYFAVLIESLPWNNPNVIDFDKKGPSHPEGGDPKTIDKTMQEWGITDYLWTQKTEGGGTHAFFRGGPAGVKSESNKLGKGIDYLTGPHLATLYDPSLWQRDVRDVYEMPDQVLKIFDTIKKKKVLKMPGKGGHGQTNKLLNSGFGTFARSTARHIVQKVDSILTEYSKNPGKTPKSEALDKLVKSLQDGLNQRGLNPTMSSVLKDSGQGAKKILMPEPITILSKPRKWIFNEKVLIKGRPNQLIGPAGVGKSSFTREYAYRWWKAGGVAVLFAQEDDFHEDISPWMQSKDFKEGEKVDRFYVITDWLKNPPLQTLLTLKHIPNKLVGIDPVHAIFTELGNPAACREKIFAIQNQGLAPGDTVVFVNHPTRRWKEDKVSPGEIAASTKELDRICRGSTFMKHDQSTGLNIVEHSKRQLSAPRFCFELVEATIENKEGQVCTFSDVQNWKALDEKPGTPDPLLKQTKNLSDRREKIRNVILTTCQEATRGKTDHWVPRETLETALKPLKLKDWELRDELPKMVQEGILMGKGPKQARVYRPIKPI